VVAHPRIPPSGVIACFVSNFVAMATRVGRCKIWLTLFDSPTQKTPVLRKNLRASSYTSRVITDFVPNFVAMATGVGHSRICLASFNSPTPKTPAVRKDLRDISHISRVIADFVPNFVAMVTGVGRSRICLALFNSPTPKTPCHTQRSPGYLLYKSSYSRFCPKFRWNGNGGWSW